jgi:protein tyrosine phosphatase (PTP) superfamily phosphohydrolase (DUF442 family)
MDIQNYYQYNELLASGAQPSRDQIEALKKNQFEVVVNISPITAKNALLNEAALVEQQQMDYVHFPVDCSHLRPIHYNTFKGIMNGLEGKKVFVHCGGNIKSSNLIHMYHVMEKGMDESESLDTLKKIQNPEDKWFFYFKRMGMKGINE